MTNIFLKNNIKIISECLLGKKLKLGKKKIKNPQYDILLKEETVRKRKGPPLETEVLKHTKKV